MKSMMRRSLAIVMVVAMLLSVLAMPVLAADHDHGTACEHKAQITPVHVDATCAQNGGDWYYCNVEGCGRVWVENLQPKTNDHDYVPGTPIAANCTEPAKVASVCSVCGDAKDAEAVEGSVALGHDPVYNFVGTPGEAFECIQGGVMYWECQRDGCDANGSETVETQGHNYVLDDEYAAANCENDGWVRVYCTNQHVNEETGALELCDKDFTVVLAKTGHAAIQYEGKKPTCDEVGYQPNTYCDHIADVDQDGHPEYDENGDPILCGIPEGAEIPALGHDWVDVTADAEGYIWIVTDENGKITVVDAETEGAEKVLQHEDGICGEDTYELGYAYQECSVCHKIARNDVEPEHDWKKGATVAPECGPNLEDMVDGYTIYTCSKCMESKRDDIVTARHDFAVELSGVANPHIVYTFILNNGSYLTDNNGMWVQVHHRATDDAEAVAAAVKAVVDAQKALGVTVKSVPWLVMKDAVCGETGQWIHACAKEDCGYMENKLWPSSHVKDTNVPVVTVDPTCTTQGYDQYTCAKCLKTDCKENFVDALGHMGPDGVHLGLDADGNPKAYLVIEQAPTCTEPGEEAHNYCYYAEWCAANDAEPEWTCPLTTNSGDEIPATGHKYGIAADSSEYSTYYALVDATCAYASFYVQKCINPGCTTEDGNPFTKNLDPNFADQLEAEGITSFRVEGTPVVGAPDYNNHVDPVEVEGTAIDATCANIGVTASVKCNHCAVTVPGEEIPKLNPDDDNGAGWASTTTPPTCMEDGYITTYCKFCAEDLAAGKITEKVHADRVEYPESLKANRQHIITGANYYMPNGTYEWDFTGSIYYVVDLGTAELIKEDDYREGTCAELLDVQAHAGWYLCSGCDTEQYISVRFTHTSDGPATCLEADNCTECDEEINPILPHSYTQTGEGDVVAPTCVKPGYTVYHCVNGCTGTEKRDSTDATGHDAAEGDVVGCEHTVYCANEGCEAEQQALFAEENPEATPEEIAAVTAYVIEAATGHNVGENKGEVIASCLTEGYKWEQCANDNCNYNDVLNGVATKGYHKYDVQEKADHDITKLVIERDADCLLYGVTVMICKDCYVTTEASNFEASLGHNFGKGNTDEENGIYYFAPDCTTDGKAYMECQVCKNSDTDAWKTAEDWTGRTGYINLTSEYENMGATGHHNNVADLNTELEGAINDVLTMNCQAIKDLIAKYEGVELAEGTEILTCKDCDAEFSVAKAHLETMVEITVNATCKNDGYTANFCKTCGEQEILTVDRLADKTPEQIEALHDYDEVDRKDATYTEDGWVKYECSVCGKDKEEPLDCLDGIHFTATIENVHGEDAAIVNNSVIKYTISISAAQKAIYMLQLSVNFNEDELSFIGYDLGEDGANLFGTMNAHGESTTKAFAKDGVVTVLANNENDENGNIVNAELDGTVEFVTLYFRVNGETITNETAAKSFESEIIMNANNIFVINKDYQMLTGATVTNADAFEVEMLGDYNGDGIINIKDAVAAKNLGAKGTYDATLDIDMDGVITDADFAEIQKYIIGATDYAGLLAAGLPA